MHPYFKKVTEYAEAHTSDLGDVLKALERETHLKTLAPQMLSGPHQGQLLRFISLMHRPERILEIGTYTGYAAICLCAGLPEDGQLHTIEVNRELEWIARKYFKLAGVENKITLHVGDAKIILPELEEQYDLVFIDAGKLDNEFYYELSLNRLNTGGLILIDNVLWSGKVVEKERDIDTASIRAFNDKIQEDKRVENLLLPIRDGLTIVRKK